MKNLSACILAMSGILSKHVMCSSDYQVFHTSDSGLSSDPIYQHDDYQQDSAKKNEFDLSGYKRISPTPKFTQSHLYISPENAEPHFTRSVSQSKDGYGDGYTSFVQKHFHDNDDDHVNSNYRQTNYGDDDEDEDVNSEYRQNNDAGNDDDDDDNNEEVNSRYQQNDDDDEEVKSNYQDAPKEVDQNDQHYHNNGDYEFERIQSLPQKEAKQPLKNCKIIVKGKAMCKLCKDPFSGAHSESCSFSSAAPEHKYAYIKKEKYIS